MKDELLATAQKIQNHLASPRHEKKPHIGIVGPPSKLLILRSLLEEEGEGEEIEDIDDYLTKRAPNTVGFRAFCSGAEKGMAHIKWSWFFRVAPPTEGDAGVRGAEVELDVYGREKGLITVKLKDEYGQTVFNDKLELELKGGLQHIRLPDDLSPQAVENFGSKPFDGKIICTNVKAEEEGGKFKEYLPASEYSAVQTVQLTVGWANDRELVFIIRNLGCVLYSHTDGEPANRSLIPDMLLANGGGSTWSAGILMDYKGEFKLKGMRLNADFKKSISPINSVVKNTGADVFQFLHTLVEEEKVVRPDESDKSVKVFLQDISSELGLPKQIPYLLTEALKAVGVDKRLYTFQEEAFKEVLRGLIYGESDAVAVTAGTASGKTIAFLLPCLAWILRKKIMGEKGGCSAILIYPTNALANDQANTILKMLLRINRSLPEDKFIRLGIFTGSMSVSALEEHQGEELRMSCPDCGSPIVVDTTSDPYPKWAHRCSSDRCPASDPIRRFFTVVREDIVSNPPDILITTPDMINYRLMEPSVKVRSTAAFVSLLGAPVKKCGVCGIAIADLDRRKCPFCGSNRLEVVEYSPPDVVVFDEAHTLRGSFGAQVSYVFSRLEQAVKWFTGKNKMFYVFSSATFSNPERRVRELLLGRERIKKVAFSYRGGSPSSNSGRIHMFVMPKGYKPAATVAHIVYTIIREHLKANGRVPRILIFCEKLAEVNELVGTIRDIVPELLRLDGINQHVEVEGHTTDLDEERRDIERRFCDSSDRHVHVLVATRGLEVGVDFRGLNYLIMYGLPFYLSDHHQRIGRAGRGEGEWALVINVILDRPTDLFYLQRYEVITDLTEKEKFLRREALPVGITNETVISRSAQRAVYDYISINEAGMKIHEALLSRKSPGFYAEQLQRILQETGKIIQYCRKALRSSEVAEHFGYLIKFSVEDTIKAAVEEEVNKIEARMRGSKRSSQLLSIDSGEERRLRNLRSSDVDTIMKFEEDGFVRHRPCGFVVRSYYKSSTALFAGMPYIVETISHSNPVVLKWGGEEK